MSRTVCLLLFALSATSLYAQTPTISQSRSGSIDLSHGWVTHEGDNPAWGTSDIDTGTWSPVDLDDMGPAKSGWRWYRKRIQFQPGFADASLLLEGADGTYEIFVNGSRLPGASIHSAFNVSRPTERAFALRVGNGDYTIALRTHAPANYVDYKLPLFLSATIGMPAEIEYQRAAVQAERLNGVWPSIAINILLCLAAIGVLCLFLGQHSHRDYLYLGLYLFALGVANGLWNLQQAGVAPTSCNVLISDPLIYVYSILQIEFTFSFVGKHPSHALRIYQAALLLCWIFAGLCWTNHLPVDTYALIEAAITIPVAIILMTLLLVWYRRGNHEAGWLILPSLLPLLADGLFDLGTTSIVLGWQRFDFLDSPIAVGLLELQITDLANLLFLISILVVLFFRITRVSREQARAEAELEAAREVQRQLVPAVLPPTRDLRIETAFLPAHEVGGDFYQVLQQSDSGTLIVVGDVSGKGLKAAMTGALAIGSLRTLAEEGLKPAELFTRLNQQINSAQKGGFVTCLALQVTSDGRATFANAGHLPPYINGTEFALEASFPLGIFPGVEYTAQSISLTPGDTLTLLTDGVVEAQDSSGALFGFERTRAISSQRADRIAAEAQKFGQEDDITVLTVTFSSAKTMA